MGFTLRCDRRYPASSRQHIPAELDTIADLHKLSSLLAARGYGETDIAAIFGGNWIDHLRRNLPA